MIYIYVMSSIK